MVKSFCIPNNALGMTYFIEIENPKYQKTHICVLCARRVNLTHRSNAEKHLKGNHSEVDIAKHYSRSFSAIDAARGSIKKLLEQGKEEQYQSVEKRTRAKYTSKLNQLSPTQKQLIIAQLVKLCTAWLLPYSFIEWEELIELLEMCIAMLPGKVRK